ncbi:hypothetical protein AMD27_00295 [Acinetobacter sp. TGL-Y2]|uniref:hypothetical protein n=1 Tax=Acinetobacter sp. TGL-Y2 TaxID=1407071 RepID=UPI0007A66902|nr:hypothetical protein [Acinetobacter sp. TGL-Y2]AMW77499.1 hypothetical protein AMD27_00295 [Acinetobacter sp. TGL-Y2]
MTQANEPIIENIYTFYQVKPSSTYPENSFTFATTAENQLYTADLKGTIEVNKINKPNPHFGVYLIPLSKDLIQRLNRVNNLLANKKRMAAFKETGYMHFNYSIKKGLSDYSDSIYFSLADDFNTDFRQENLSKELRDLNKTAHIIGKTLQEVASFSNKDRQLYSTIKTSHSIEQLKDGLKVKMIFKSIGNTGASISHPAKWKKLEAGSDIQAFDQWAKISYGGVYNNESYSLDLYLLPEYLDKTSLSEDEVKNKDFLKIKPNTVRTISFIIPYKNISFYSAKDETFLGWNEGNRDSQGRILFDHSAISGSWYLEIYMSIFSKYVLHKGEELTQLN